MLVPVMQPMTRRIAIAVPGVVLRSRSTQLTLQLNLSVIPAAVLQPAFARADAPEAFVLGDDGFEPFLELFLFVAREATAAAGGPCRGKPGDCERVVEFLVEDRGEAGGLSDSHSVEPLAGFFPVLEGAN